MPEPGDLYKTLQVDPEADPEVIQAAYRRLAQKYHPDLAGDGDPEASREAGARMVAINAAWAILRDPAERAAYDRGRALAAAASVDHASERTAGPPSAASPSAEAPTARAAGEGRPETTPRSDDRWRPRAAGGRPESRPDAGRRGPGPAEEGTPQTPSRADPARTAPPGPAAGPPPGPPSGSILTFGRYSGWSLGEIARVDPEYLEWLDRTPIGRPHREELERLLRQLGRRVSTERAASERRGLFRRR
jgi:curved DNA-binding protein CbpA